MQNSKLKTKIQNYKYEIILYLIVLVYIVLFSYLSIRKYLTFQSHYFDLGIMNQVVYNTSKGYFLEMTNQDFVQNASRLAIHFDPILAVFAPFYLIWNSPDILLVAQTIVLALGAVAVYFIAKLLLDKKIYGLLFAVSYLLFFAVERANVFDFHAVTLATTFLLFAIYFSLTKKFIRSFFCLILALITKEHVGLVTFFFGLYLFFIKKERKFALSIMLVSLVFFAATVFYLIPYFRGGSHFALSRYSDFGETPGRIIFGIIKNPKLIGLYLLRHESFLYLQRLLLPNGILMIFAPLEFLIALPELMLNLLSSNSNMRDIYFHYNSLIVPFVFLSSIYGLKKIREAGCLKKLTGVFVAVFIMTTLISVYYLNPLPFSFLKEPYWWGQIDEKKIAVVKTWQNILKDDRIKVATTPKLAPFFSARRYYYNFLFDPSYAGAGLTADDIIKTVNDYRFADYVIINRDEIDECNAASLTAKFYWQLRNDRLFVKIFDQEKIEVYKQVKN